MKPLAVDAAFLLAVDDDVSPQELEEGIEKALRMIPGVRAVNLPQLNIIPAGEEAFCCPICGGSIQQIVSMQGMYIATVGLASGLAQDGQFEGKHSVEFLCEDDATHEIPATLVSLLRSSLEISPKAAT